MPKSRQTGRICHGMIKFSRDAKVPAYGQGLSWYDKVVTMAESRRAKKHVFGGEGMVAGKGRQTLARASEVMVEWGRGACLAANGSVVAVVSVGGAVRRYVSWYFRSD
jgi:hypothetical protein